MGAAEVYQDDAQPSGDPGRGPGRTLAIAPEAVVVRRDARVLALVGAAAAAVALAYLARAVGGGGAADVAMTVVLAMLAVPYLWAAADARTPLLVADVHGVRVRLGRAWRGLTWGSLSRVEHLPRRGPLRDGRLVLVPREPEPVRGWHARLMARLYGSPLALPLGLTTRTSHGDAELTEALSSLAAGATLVVEPLSLIEPEDVESAHLIEPEDVESAHLIEPEDVESAHLITSPTPSPLRAAILGRRAEVTLPAADPSDAVLEDRPEAVAAPVWEPDPEPAAVVDPVIGPQLAAARHRLGLAVDQLAERTRIRPHVIEAIEVDDFEPCGGDFYARGHLRTLARVLGVDVVPLIAEYDERYARAPVDTGRVFDADLGPGLVTGGAIRGTRGGPNWSVLVAAVMALVLAWSIARLVMESPAPVRSEPALNGSAGIGNGSRQAGPTVPVLVRAAGGGATVEVRDGTGKIVFTGDVAYGQTRALEVRPPVRVSSSDGSVEVVVDGTEKGALGETGQEASGTFVVR